MSDFLLQIVLFLAAAIIGIIVPLTRVRWQKIIAGFLSILLFIVSGLWILLELGTRFAPLVFGQSKSLDCSLTTEIKPWSASDVITLNPDRDGWVQADFSLSPGAIIAGFDEVSVIIEPYLRIKVSGAAGIAWKYDRSWKREDVEWCTQKHIQDSLNLRQKRLILISPTELCSVLGCQ